MLLAWRFEPSRFFLKGKVRHEKTSYIHKHAVWEEVKSGVKWTQKKKIENNKTSVSHLLQIQKSIFQPDSFSFERNNEYIKTYLLDFLHLLRFIILLLFVLK